MAIYYNEQNKQNAQQLRRNMTKQERHLWYDFLKTYPFQFRRQKQFGPYIVDFYCSKAKLVVEVDGRQHFEEKGLEHDRERDDYLKSLNLVVMRIPNNEIDHNFTGVCEQIETLVKGRI